MNVFEDGGECERCVRCVLVSCKRLKECAFIDESSDHGKTAVMVQLHLQSHFCERI